MKKEMRGGLRWNSAALHESHKVRKYICTWCDQGFESNSNVQSVMKRTPNDPANPRYCSDDHRIKMFLLKKSLKNKHRVTKKDRKRHTFRPEVWRA